MIDLFLQSYCYRYHYLHKPHYDVFAFLDRAAEDGFTGVSININGPNYRQLSGTSIAHQHAVGQGLAALDLRCDIETSGTTRAHLSTMLELCGRLRVKQLRTYMRHDGTVDETIERTIADLCAAGPMFGEAGVKLLLENHEDFTGAEMVRILSAVNHPAIGALFDYGNSMMVGEEPLTALSAMLPFVRAVHLKDHACALGRGGEQRILGVPIGSGVLPIAEATRRLTSAGLDYIIMSSVWGYQAPVHAWRGDGAWGRGVFRPEEGPFDPLRRPWQAEALGASDPARLVALEVEAVRQGQTWLRATLKEIGVTVRQR